MYLGIDTSNYTTSAALLSMQQGKNVSRLLDVAPGTLGLRQSDALFQHVKRLPEIMQTLLSSFDGKQICAIAASTRPRAVEGSYMPCFLAGESTAKSMAQALGVPFHAVSHQQGHIAAVLWSAGRMNLLNQPFLAWHLSGGTTELLLIEPEGALFSAKKIGGTTDISAGQAIDRAGVMLSLPFPAGKSLDELAADSGISDCFRVKLNGLDFSFSGLENKAQEFYAHSNNHADTAAYVIGSVCDLIHRATLAALKAYPEYPVVFSGGVSSNRRLRAVCNDFDAVFSEPQYATDNAMGVAVLCSLLEG